MRKKLLALVLSLCLILTLALPAAADMGNLESYGVQLIQYYLHHQEAATDVIWDIIRQMEQLDPKQASTWEKLMFDWAWINTDMPVYEQEIPQGLPTDDSLCIVVMGFGLNADGSIRPELENRLKMAMTFATSYPNAYVLVTGGQTGAVDGVTEAGQMERWLRENGLSGSRIIQENQSLSTAANAVNSYKLLTRAYPKVDSIAVVTSDYHIAQSCAMFAAVSNYQSGYKGGKSLELVGNVVCDTGLTEDSLVTQAWGISLIMGLPFDEKAKAPELYSVDIPQEVYTEPETEPREEAQIAASEQDVPVVEEKTEQAQPDPKTRWMVPTGCVLAALLVLWVIAPKKPKKRNRRERPKMNWDVE